MTQIINSQINIVLLVGFLATAVYFDARLHKIPNWLTLTGCVVGVLLALFSSNHLPDIRQALTGLAVGLMILLPFYALGKMGAGDVKLLGMSGLFLGAQTTLWAGLCTLIAGGIFAVLWLCYTGGVRYGAHYLLGCWLKVTAGRLSAAGNSSDQSVPSEKFPYAAAIASGCLIAYWLDQKDMF